MLKLTNNTDWLLQKAKEEEGVSFSVGGLYARLDKVSEWMKEAAEAESAASFPTGQVTLKKAGEPKIAKLCLSLELQPHLKPSQAGLAVTRFVDQLSTMERTQGGTGLRVSDEQEESDNGCILLYLEPLTPIDFQRDEARLLRIAAQVKTIRLDHSSIANIHAHVA